MSDSNARHEMAQAIREAFERDLATVMPRPATVEVDERELASLAARLTEANLARATLTADLAATRRKLAGLVAAVDETVADLKQIADLPRLRAAADAAREGGDDGERRLRDAPRPR